MGSNPWVVEEAWREYNAVLSELKTKMPDFRAQGNNAEVEHARCFQRLVKLGEIPKPFGRSRYYRDSYHKIIRAGKR